MSRSDRLHQAAITARAIHDLEVYGHWMGSRYIAIDFDKAHKQVLEKAVAVLDAAGMIERDPHPKWKDCNVRIINKKAEKDD